MFVWEPRGVDVNRDKGSKLTFNTAFHFAFPPYQRSDLARVSLFPPSRTSSDLVDFPSSCLSFVEVDLST